MVAETPMVKEEQREVSKKILEKYEIIGSRSRVGIEVEIIKENKELLREIILSDEYVLDIIKDAEESLEIKLSDYKNKGYNENEIEIRRFIVCNFSETAEVVHVYYIEIEIYIKTHELRDYINRDVDTFIKLTSISFDKERNEKGYRIKKELELRLLEREIERLRNENEELKLRIEELENKLRECEP